jgi:hypothetical protein
MRLCAALALLLVVLVVVTGTVLSRRRAPREAVATGTAGPARFDAAERPVPEVASRRPIAVPVQRGRTTIAHLHGRALPPAGRGSADGLPDLRVTADDGRRTFAGAISKGGLFAFHMPPGRYTLTAWASDMVGELHDVLVFTDVEREVDLPLVKEARIGGRLHKPRDVSVDVSVRPTGGERPGQASESAGDGFLIEGLIPGRRYDVEFSGPDVRTLKIQGVTVPAESMEVTLEARAIVRVVIGIPPGERCPINAVTVRRGDTENGFTTDAGQDLDCRFQLRAPADAGDVTVVAQGGGWLLQADVTVPAHGDPEPLCLNPPCLPVPTDPDGV